MALPSETRKNKKVFTDLSGQTYGDLLVLHRVPVPDHVKNKSGAYFLCRCKCGKETKVAASSLKRGDIKTCGCSKTHDVTGKKFGKLLVLKRVSRPNTRSDKTRDSFWLCRCDCGREVTMAGGDLRRNTSCGCGRRISDPNLAREITINYIYDYRYADGDLSVNEFVALSQLPCHYCGELPSRQFNRHSLSKGNTQFAVEHGNFTYNGLDRIDPAMPHNANNVVPCCAICNWMKTDHTTDQFIRHITKIYNHIAAAGLKESHPHDVVIK